MLAALRSHILVNWNIWLSAIHGADCETALLQFGFGVIPVLVHDEVLQSWEETHVAKHVTVFQSLGTENTKI
jgi:hypothetical protein